VAFAQILLGGEQQVDHQFDDFARGEVLPGFFVGLFRADPDQFLERITHLYLIDPLWREVDFGESLDHLEQDVFFRYMGDILAELELLHDGAHVGGEGMDVAVQVGRGVVGVGEQGGNLFARQGELHL